jgi:predicted TIM-barrel fold metal-dependent hydrolase
MSEIALSEPILEAELPIVDAHHHLWLLPEAALAATEADDTLCSRALAPLLRRHARYLFDEFLADLKSGHNIRASVFVDAHAMYRSSGPEEMKSVGEIEFVNGCAAMAESGLFGEIKVCAGIVGGVDLRMGDAVKEVLSAHLRAGGGRYRGVRSAAVVAYDEDEHILGPGVGVPHLLLDKQFRKGFKWLHKLGLSFDVWLFEPQLPELIDLARTFPETSIILNNIGAPVGIGRYAGQREARFPIWRDHIRTLSRCPNVTVKLAGLGLPFGGFKSYMANPPASSLELSEEWKPYIETCIEAFGANRCMFASNFPVEGAAASYSVLWNAFKRLASGASEEEKNGLFSATATNVYRLDI